MTITAEQLAKLDKAATQGEWKSDAADPSDVVIWGGKSTFVANIGDNQPRPASVAFDIESRDAELIAATVNAYRDGTLVHVDEVEKLREVLRPFAEVLSVYLPLKDMQLVLLSEDNPKARRLAHLLPDHFEAARAALGDSQ